MFGLHELFQGLNALTLAAGISLAPQAQGPVDPIPYWDFPGCRVINFPAIVIGPDESWLYGEGISTPGLDESVICRQKTRLSHELVLSARGCEDAVFSKIGLLPGGGAEAIFIGHIPVSQGVAVGCTLSVSVPEIQYHDPFPSREIQRA